MSPARSRFVLFCIDIALINLAFVIGYSMRYQLQLLRDVQYEAKFSEYGLVQVIFNITLLVMFWWDGVYTPKRAPSWFDQMFAVLNATIKSLFIIWALIFLIRPTVYSQLMILWAGAGVVVLIGLSRFMRARVAASQRRRGIDIANVLIVGAGELGRTVMRNIMARPELGYRVIGFVDDDAERGSTDIGRFPALGEVSAIHDILSAYKVDEAIVTLPWSAQPKIVEVVNLCNQHNVRARVVPSLLQINLSRVDVDDLGGIPLIGERQPVFGRIGEIVKRIFDLSIALPMSIVSLPIIGVASLLIWLDSPGPAIFRQPRAGKGGKPFQCFKLRSMVANAEQERDKLQAMNEADGPIFKIKNDPRTTRIGRIMRKLSIDELPQFWNVLRGEMSVVGPRPALLHEVTQYNEWQHERLRVRPGITGLWQISGRSELTFDEMCLLDVYYIENQSLSLDLKIVLKTVPYLLSAHGAY